MQFTTCLKLDVYLLLIRGPYEYGEHRRPCKCDGHHVIIKILVKHFMWNYLQVTSVYTAVSIVRFANDNNNSLVIVRHSHYY